MEILKAHKSGDILNEQIPDSQNPIYKFIISSQLVSPCICPHTLSFLYIYYMIVINVCSFENTPRLNKQPIQLHIPQFRLKFSSNNILELAFRVCSCTCSSYNRFDIFIFVIKVANFNVLIIDLKMAQRSAETCNR